MLEVNSPQCVVVTDLRMPFWSMVVFMVKWSIAAIPAIILLVTIVMGSTAFVSGLISSIRFVSHESERVRNYTPEHEVRQTQIGPNSHIRSNPEIPERCIGSLEQEKCVEMERRLAAETPEQKVQRQNALEAARQAAMEQVR